MIKQTSLKDQLIRLVLPMIIIPLALSGCLAFFIYYRDAQIRLERYLSQRKTDIQSLGENASIEDFFVSREFHLSEEMDFHRKKIGQLLTEYIRIFNSANLVYHKLAVFDEKKHLIAEKGESGELIDQLLGSDPDPQQKIKSLRKNQLFSLKKQNRVVCAMPIYLDFNTDGKFSADEFRGVVASEFVYPIKDYRSAAMNTAMVTVVLLVGAFLIGLFLTRRFIGHITKPLSDLSVRVSRISSGQFDQYVETNSAYEIGNLAASFNQMQDRLKTSHNRIREQISLLKSLTISSQRISSSLNTKDVVTNLALEIRKTVICHQICVVLSNEMDTLTIYVSPRVATDGAFRRCDWEIRNAGPEEAHFIRTYLETDQVVSTHEGGIDKQQIPSGFLDIEDIEQLTGISVFVKDKPVGGIWLNLPSDHALTEERQDFLKSIAIQAAISLENANLFEEVKKIKELLEEDIKAREKGEKEKEKLQVQLQQAQKMESIGNLAGGIAHDFNNMLFSILGYTELALEEVDKDSPLAASLKEILIAGHRAKDLVKQILTFARQSNEESKPIRVDITTKEALKFVRSSIPTTIDIKQDIRSKSLIMGNQTQIHQIVVNLCTNAAHAMEEHGGTLEVSLTDLHFESEVDISHETLIPGTYLQLSVKDTGIGIPPEIRESIFEPYFTTKDTGHGTGMGLAIVHGIVKSYGGIITVTSEAEKGATFTVYLPTVKSQVVETDIDMEALPTGTERILFIDDESSIAHMIRRMLARFGYRVTCRTSGIEALALFQSNPNRYDLVVTDMTMPQITGNVLAKEMLKIRPDIPVILCTGYNNKISQDTAAETGIKRVILKPIVKKDLLNIIREVLDNRSDRPRSSRRPTLDTKDA